MVRRERPAEGGDRAVPHLEGDPRDRHRVCPEQLAGPVHAHLAQDLHRAAPDGAPEPLGQRGSGQMNQARHPVEGPRITRPGGESGHHLGDLGIPDRPRRLVLSGGEPRRRHRRADQAGIAHRERGHRGHPALIAERTGRHQPGHAGVLVAEPARQERARQRRRRDGEPQVGVHKIAIGRRGEVVRRTRIDEQCVPGPHRQRPVGGLQDQLTRFDERPEVAWASQSPAGRQPFVSQQGHFPLHVGPSHRGPARYSRRRSRPQSAYVSSAPHLPPSSKSAWPAGTRPCSVPTST